MPWTINSEQYTTEEMSYYDCSIKRTREFLFNTGVAKILNHILCVRLCFKNCYIVLWNLRGWLSCIDSVHKVDLRMASSDVSFIKSKVHLTNTTQSVVEIKNTLYQ